MENFIIYLAKASGLLALFFLAYYFLLRKETFFTANRWFLLTGLFSSVILPFVEYTQVIWVESLPKQAVQAVSLEQLMMVQNTIAAQSQETIFIDWTNLLIGIYFAGILFFFARFFLDFIAIKRLLNGNTILRHQNFRFIDSDKVQSPFSFFNYIVYNSAVLNQDEVNNIISHEKVHSTQKHSLDMIFSQLFCVVFWFNPFVWLYKKSIAQNLEFIADAEAVKHLHDSKAYQKTLLKITVQPGRTAITNHFYQSLIKKRIIMLNKKQSSRLNVWKYATVLPALAVFMLMFQEKAVAQEKGTETKIISTKIKIILEITKDSKPEELQAFKKLLKEEFDADVNFKDIVWNQKDEITGLKVIVNNDGQSQGYVVAGKNPIAPFTIEVKKDNSGHNAISFGSGSKDNSLVRSNIISSGNPADKSLNDSIRKGNTIMVSGDTEDKNPPSVTPQVAGHWSVNSLKIGDDDMLIVINGVKQERGENIKLPLNHEIDTFTILKDREGKKKYGKDGKKGVVEITTKKSIATLYLNPGTSEYTYVTPNENSRQGVVTIHGMSPIEINLNTFAEDIVTTPGKAYGVKPIFYGNLEHVQEKVSARPELSKIFYEFKEKNTDIPDEE